MTATWRGIPVPDLAHAGPAAQRRLLALLAREMAEAAGRHRAILLARRLAEVTAVQPDHAFLAEARLRANGWYAWTDEARRETDRNRRRVERAAARAGAA